MTIAVAGATGNLGTRIVKALLARKAGVVAVVRASTSADKVAALHALGAETATEIPTHTTCVVSAVQGLRDVIVDAQANLATAARAVGARFIPSDYSTDYRALPPGENRNFDWRRELHERIGPTAVTAIFNGAFAEVLTYGSPLLDRKNQRVAYFQDADWRMDFTTMDDTAAFTAAAALDDRAPEALRCASFQVTPRELAAAATTAFGAPFELVRLGSLDDLRAKNKADRAAHPEGEGELHPTWQRGMYMQSMTSTHHASIDNDRYPEIAWTSVAEFLGAVAKGASR
ncbi:MAG TPA: NmrA family NAD(P)-binding protein [Kofleriaceae bacterium]|jgi:nucleoside-diphosphate-sugar epimerase